MPFLSPAGREIGRGARRAADRPRTGLRPAIIIADFVAIGPTAESVGIGFEEQCDLEQPRFRCRVPGLARQAPRQLRSPTDRGNCFLARQGRRCSSDVMRKARPIGAGRAFPFGDFLAGSPEPLAVAPPKPASARLRYHWRRGCEPGRPHQHGEALRFQALRAGPQRMVKSSSRAARPDGVSWTQIERRSDLDSVRFTRPLSTR